jgi:hypothetical protein
LSASSTASNEALEPSIGTRMRLNSDPFAIRRA